MPATVNPTRMELNKTKKRLKTALRGYKLLKDKQDEMARQFMTYIRLNKKLRDETESKMSAAMNKMYAAEAQMGSFALEEALYITSDTEKPDFLTKSIMNLDVPDIRHKESGAGGISYGLAFSAHRLDDAVLAMAELMPRLYELAAVEKTCDLLADELERTRRRVNALENVMIPEMEQTIKYISLKLADNERGALVRLMKVKDLMVENI